MFLNDRFFRNVDDVRCNRKMRLEIRVASCSNILRAYWKRRRVNDMPSLVSKYIRNYLFQIINVPFTLIIFPIYRWKFQILSGKRENFKYETTWVRTFVFLNLKGEAILNYVYQCRYIRTWSSIATFKFMSDRNIRLSRTRQTLVYKHGQAREYQRGCLSVHLWKSHWCRWNRAIDLNAKRC